MLFFFHGENFNNRTIKMKEVLTTLREKKKDALYFHFDYLDISAEKLAELIQTIGLLEQKNIILLSNIFKNLEAKEFFLDNLNLFEKSDNAFVLTEEVVDKRNITKITKFSFKVYDFPLQKNSFNIFKLSDFLQNRQKKELWLFFHTTLKRGVPLEEFFGIMMWSLKTLASAEKFSMSESGLRPFVYKKAQTSLSKWQEGEIENKLFEAIILFHKTRFSGLNLKSSLEKFILEI